MDKLYIAGIGMITSLGENTSTTTAAVNAGISRYAVSNYYGDNSDPITMANIPDAALAEIEAELDEGDVFCERHYRVTLMAIDSVREACSTLNSKEVIPLFVAMPDVDEDTDGLVPMVNELEENCQPRISTSKSRSIYTGRAAGIEAIDFAFRHADTTNDNYILVGGSDSYQDYDRINPLAEKNRLLEQGNMNGFVPGEAACFLLLTSKVELAKQHKRKVIALHPPGIANEPGHFHSEEPYKGDGLDQAFKKALGNSSNSKINSIYSSMNGEHYWAKELGVAFTRNKSAFYDSTNTEHPADLLGDVGSATGSLLVALAVKNLFNNSKVNKHLVYSSSDTARRGAIILEKMSLADIN